MSTILKALKKLEDHQRAATPVNLAGKIATAGAAPRHRTRSTLLLSVGALGGLLLALAVLGGWLWWQQAPPTNDLAPAPVAAPAGQPVPVDTGESAQALQVASASRLPVAVPPQPVSIAAAKPRPVSAPPSAAAPPAITPQPPAASQSAMRQEPAVPEQRHDSPPREIKLADRQLPPPGQQWSTPHLVVTEIFPPSAGSGWMAVVNGLPVMDGTMVEDAVVEEIRADHVLFLIQGKVVAVPLRNKR